MAPAALPPAAAPLSKLAKKYGHPYKRIDGKSHRILKNTGKSGIVSSRKNFCHLGHVNRQHHEI
jgi:hypothetical protein